MQKAVQFFLPFLKKVQVAKNTFSFYFDRSKTDFDFLPGQYIRMSLPHKNVDERGTTRFFTIASSPHERDYWMFTIKIIESSFKKAMFDLQPLQPVQFFGPMGTFFLDENDQTERVFLAGGIGMTPFYSMITYAAAKKLQIPMTLFVGFSTAEDIVFYEQLNAVFKEYPYLKPIYTITQSSNESMWKGEKGRISADLIQRVVRDIMQPEYFIVGSPEVVEDFKKLLQQLGILEERIHLEEFSGY